jgi:hypothetical protein
VTSAGDGVPEIIVVDTNFLRAASFMGRQKHVAALVPVWRDKLTDQMGNVTQHAGYELVRVIPQFRTGIPRGTSPSTRSRGQADRGAPATGAA